MLEYIKENCMEILSIIGAAAWLPIVFGPIIRGIINYFRKIQATILDSRILTDGQGVSVGKRQIKKGTILMFATNLFIEKTTVFARKISVKVELKNGAKLNTELLDFSTITSNNDDKTKSIFNVPIDKEFNISRTIHPNIDNIKYIAVLVESADFARIDEISEIHIRLFYHSLKCKLFSKKIVIRSSDFPTFNSSHLIDMVERFNK